jgi:hypothetical protein
MQLPHRIISSKWKDTLLTLHLQHADLSNPFSRSEKIQHLIYVVHPVANGKILDQNDIFGREAHYIY